MQIRVSNKLIITDYPKAVRDWCNKNLILANPEYHKKERMGLWTGSTPRWIWLFEEIGGELHVPFGCVRNLNNEFCGNIVYDYQIQPIRKFLYRSNINLYPYQEIAVKSVLERKNGILVAPCGSGKTNMGMEIISRIGGRTLWLTHTQDLLNQSYNRALSVFDDIPLADYGRITAGKVYIGKGITFATVQTLSRLNLSQYKDLWDVIIVDECQHCCGSPTKVTQFYKVISSLSARYKIGLTATPKRADGLEQSMFALLGDVIHEVSREEVKETTCPVKVFQCDTNYQPNYNAILMGDGTINYAKLVDDLVDDENRYLTVFKKLEDIKTSAIVLANRVRYLQKLNKDFNKFVGKSICLSMLGNSKKAKAERKEALRKLNDGEIDCIFATYQLAKEGLDCPNLRYVVFATPEKDETTVIQSVGRVGRKSEGKEYGTVIDFIDDFGMYRGWAKKRVGYYKKIDAEVL